MRHFTPWALTLLLAAACGGDPESTGTGGTTATGGTGGTSSTGEGGGNGGGDGGTVVTGDRYALDSKFSPGDSAVAYPGQTFRHTLIESMKVYVGGLTALIDGAGNPPQTQAELVAALDYYYDYDAASSGQDSHGVQTDPATAQMAFDDISTSAALKSKMAGNDDVTDHQDWDGGAFVGWSDLAIAQYGGAVDTPEGLLMAMFNTLGVHVEQRINNGPPNEPGTITPIAEVFVTTEGWDLQQLMQKFLLGAITYSQGTDDYLDGDVADKGLLSSNGQDGEDPFTVLGHHWDEGFGYFGAARDYLDYSDDEIASAGGREDYQGYHDTDGSGSIDLFAEYNWGASVNCAKRDLGATTATDYTQDAYAGFWEGRKLIYGAGETLTSDEMDQLTAYAHQATDAWEAAIAATIVHYINDAISDTDAIDADPGNYSFLDHAKHWSEMKGFALGLQFNPRSKVSAMDFAMVHALMGDAPVLSTATAMARQQYVSDLLAARDILQTSYGFAAENVEGW